MPLVTKSPCINGRFKKGEYVTINTQADLWMWRHATTDGMREHCFEDVHTELLAALNCFHGRGLVHGDLKLENVKFSSFSENGCPTGLHLSGFGESTYIGTGKLRKVLKKHGADYWDFAPHLTGCIIKGRSCLLPSMKFSRWFDFGEHYVADAVVDMCSYKYILFDLFDRTITLKGAKYKDAGSCGKMGTIRIDVFVFP